MPYPSPPPTRRIARTMYLASLPLLVLALAECAARPDAPAVATTGSAAPAVSGLADQVD
ncbi:hypothetical protein [Micromonospora cathayae]|uniref:Uncharacterized protein n=1 Tax=Micromonospora cathayae TaxID=3028804 RepID=A0ABY7ZUR6_9ACTN|nr:hypothetical protein [Micromonospora sp. HUAS 3]WDZ86608.1 hypothetical protein PVK37_09515 [Micromonospora sp. HUAS 3]